jgi:hypothetical protein
VLRSLREELDMHAHSLGTHRSERLPDEGDSTAQALFQTYGEEKRLKQLKPRPSCGYERAERHIANLNQGNVSHSLRQELGGGWTIRFGPLSAANVDTALGAFVR